MAPNIKGPRKSHMRVPKSFPWSKVPEKVPDARQIQECNQQVTGCWTHFHFSLSGKCTRTPCFVQECVCQHFANLVRRIILYGICKMSNIYIQHFANFILNTKDWWSILSALWNWTDIFQTHHGSPWYKAIFVTLLLTHLFLQLKTTTKYST